MNAQGIKSTDQLSMNGEQTAFDTASDSDDSFTDVVLPARPVMGSGSHRRNAIPRYYHQSTVTPAPMQKTVIGGHNGRQSEAEDHESYVDAATTKNTRRNSITHRRIGSSSIGFSDLNTSLRHSWPQPAFVFKGKSLPDTPGHQSPVFVLRDRSNSKGVVDAYGKYAKPTSMAKRPKWRHQPPSVTDGEFDGAVFWDPTRNPGTRDA
ncbi:MAG: hypothetical protein LQ348_007183 [Seirophora lacunosa]|nr:MAG: hypothetical protein LQ344_005857 [Seirophora lacunosa]KAI4170037.1 MAG: hypothetical protein LQ348_007183 [Seirophora lacunosa]